MDNAARATAMRETAGNRFIGRCTLNLGRRRAAKWRRFAPKMKLRRKTAHDLHL